MNIFPVGHSLYMPCYERLHRIVGFLVYLCEAHHCAGDILKSKISFLYNTKIYIWTKQILPTEGHRK